MSSGGQSVAKDALEVPQFSQVLPPLPDTPRGISETPMVRVPATASLLRAFQPRSSDSFHSVYSGLRPIYATQSHPQTLNPAHIQSLRDAKLRSGSGSPNARSCLENRERSFHLSRNENHHFTLCLQGCGRFHARKIGEPPKGCQIDLLAQTLRTVYVVEIKRRREIGAEAEHGFDVVIPADRLL